MKDDLAEHRKQNFQVKIKFEHGDYYLNITHNGYQWQGINLNLDEMEIVREVLTQKLNEAK